MANGKPNILFVMGGDIDWFKLSADNRGTLACCLIAALSCAAPPALAQQASVVAGSPSADRQEAPPPPDPAVQGQADAQASEPAPKRKFFQRFIDEEDGGLDFSNFLARGGFLPIPIIITEPAVDNGFGLAAAFLKVNPERPRQVTRHIVGAFKTGNGSKGVGYFQSGYAVDGRLNYRFGIMHGKVTLESFPAFAPGGLEYTSHYDYGLIGSALWHLKGDRISIGPLFDFRKLRTEIDGITLPPALADDADAPGVELQTGALGVGFHFDSRDNPLTPKKGINLALEAKFNRGAFGSDRAYETYEGNFFAFAPLNKDLRFGFKLEADTIRGDFPFFYAPAVDLRGVQAMQYQGMNVVSSELEVNWQLTPRWSLLAFTGIGATDAGERRIFSDSGAIWAGGGGFRYRLARKLGFDAGMDFAYGPGGFVFYLQFGHAWSMKMD